MKRPTKKERDAIKKINDIKEYTYIFEYIIKNLNEEYYKPSFKNLINELKENPSKEAGELIIEFPQRYKRVIDDLYLLASKNIKIIYSKGGGEWRYTSLENKTYKIKNIVLNDKETIIKELKQYNISLEIGGVLSRSTYKGETKYIINEEEQIVPFSLNLYNKIRGRRIVVKYVKPYVGGLPE